MKPSVDSHRYSVIPRSLSFLVRAGDVLLLRLPDHHPDWPGKYNGVGGHIESGEDPASAARREIAEETGLFPTDLRLQGTILIDTGDHPGIALFVFSGEAHGDPVGSAAGEPRWVRRTDLAALPVVDDLRVLLPMILDRRPTDPPFSGIYRQGRDGTTQISFSESPARSD